MPINRGKRKRCILKRRKCFMAKVLVSVKYKKIRLGATRLLYRLTRRMMKAPFEL